jgi:hypothetical protein
MKKRTKLGIKKVTLRDLDESDLSNMAGGRTGDTCKECSQIYTARDNGITCPATCSSTCAFTCAGTCHIGCSFTLPETCAC